MTELRKRSLEVYTRRLAPAVTLPHLILRPTPHTEARLLATGRRATSRTRMGDHNTSRSDEF